MRRSGELSGVGKPCWEDKHAGLVPCPSHHVPEKQAGQGLTFHAADGETESGQGVVGVRSHSGCFVQILTFQLGPWGAPSWPVSFWGDTE